MPERFPNALVVRLEENYRSTPQVLALANRLVPGLGGAEKVLRADAGRRARSRASRPFSTPEAEGAAIVDADRAARVDGMALEEMAILCRTNARLTDFEELLHGAGLPFQGASLLVRDAARRLLRADRAERRRARPARRCARRARGGLARRRPRQARRARAGAADRPRAARRAGARRSTATRRAFVAELRQRFDPGGDGAHGVHLLTLHRSKGLEFDAVFLPRLTRRSCRRSRRGPTTRSAEERRLLYVGMTRAKRVLWLTWSGKPSRFLAELGVDAQAAPRPKRIECEGGRTPAGEKLRRWRLERARADGVPPYVVFHDSVLHAIAAAQPQSLGELSQIQRRRPGEARALRRR